MILWQKTKERFGYDEQSASSRCEIIVSCDICGSEFIRIWSSYKQKIKKNGRFLCHSCATKSGDFKSACSKRAKKLWENEEYKQNNLAAVQSDDYRQKKKDESEKRWQDEAFRAKMLSEEHIAARKASSSDTAKRNWKRPEYRAAICGKLHIRMIEQWRQQGYKAHMAAIQKENTIKMWADGVFDNCFGEDFSQKMTEINQEILSRPEVLTKLSEAGKANWDDPEYREAVIAGNKAKWKDEEYRQKMSKLRSDILSRPDILAKLSEASKANWRNMTYRKIVTTALRERWLDGILSTEASRKTIELWKSNDYRNTVATAVTIAWASPELRKAASDNSSKLWKSDEFRVKCIRSFINRWQNQAYREAVIAGLKAKWEDEEHRQKMAEIRQNQPRVSSIQTILYSILDDLGIKHYREYQDKPADKECLIGPYSVDCVIPLQNKSLVVECHGDYWHGSPQQSLRDRQKATYIHSLGDYELKVLWEHEFYCKDKIVETLKYWLGIHDIGCIDYKLTDLTIRHCPPIDYRQLLGKYHYLPNAGRGGIAYGAYLGDELIAVCIFSPPVRQNIKTHGYHLHEMCELSRLCVHPKYRKKNMLSWFVSKCISLLDNKLKLIVSYSDTTYNHTGAIYKACNFELDGEIRPDYWYVDKNGWAMHKRTLFGRASKMSMAESEFAQQYNYKKVYGSHKLRFIYKRFGGMR